MKPQRIVNFNLFAIRYPFTAVLSILHRLSGLFVFLLIPALLWLLENVLRDEESFNHIKDICLYPMSKLTVWLFLAALGYHFFAGIRHIIMDMGYGETLLAARCTGAITVLFAIAWAISVGIWLW